MAYMSTSGYLLLVSPVLHTTDHITESWKWRLFIGVFFQMSWTVGRIIGLLMIYFGSLYVSQTRIKVTFELIMILIVIYFLFESNIWNETFIKDEGKLQKKS